MRLNKYVRNILPPADDNVRAGRINDFNEGKLGLFKARF